MRRLFMVLGLGLAGCYASEKAGKDIQDTSHDVNQGGIHLHNGALGVGRPPPALSPVTTITSAPLESAGDAGAAMTDAAPISM